VFPIPSMNHSCDIVEMGFDDWPFWCRVQVCVVVLVANRNNDLMRATHDHPFLGAYNGNGYEYVLNDIL
jgi:hypothetical protein